MASKSDAEVKQETAEEATAEVSEEEAAQKVTEAADIVRRKMYYAIGVGFVPIPLLDIAALLGLQLHMVKQLSDVFGVPFSQSRGRSIISSLLGSILPVGLAGPIASGLKLIPVVGYTTSAVSLSITGGAATYAIGKIFTNHFATGGTLLNFDTEKMKSVFAEKFKEGQEVSEEMKAEA